MSKKTVEEVIQHNTEEFFEKGPGLRYNSYQTYIVARCPEAGQVLEGGLGAMGVGQMWFTETADHKNYPGYDEAPLVAVDKVW